MAGITEFGNEIFNIWGNPALTVKDPLAFVPIMETVLDKMPPNTPDLTKNWLTGLYNDYRGGHIGPTFGDEVYTCLTGIYINMACNPDKNQEFDYSYSYAVGEKRKAGLMPVTIGDTVDISAGFREEAQNAHTWEEMDAILGGLIQTGMSNANANMCLNGFLPMLEQFRQNMQSMAMQKPPVQAKMGMTSAHYLDENMMKQARYMVNAAGDMLENSHMYCKGMSDVYAQCKANYVAFAEQSDPTRIRLTDAEKTSKFYQGLEDKLRSIRDIEKKMLEDNPTFHRDSPEYKEMKEAVTRVLTCARAQGFDERIRNETKNSLSLDDGFAAQILFDEMHKLYESAEKYANKEVFGQTKSTQRGIERKNTALALIDLSKPDTVIINDKAVVDRRMDKHDKRKLSLKDMLDEEKKTNLHDRRSEIVVIRDHSNKHTPKTHASRGMGM
ncbi:MAG: hypothetical protein K5686_06910 [Lachnospiraceae bacterium]|nr:hypothetical protein [Lachnospiraceae bacterium]